MEENSQIDEFGVCHKDFSLRDEIEYNFRRAKEKEMPEFYQDWQNYNDDLSLEVKYPKDW